MNENFDDIIGFSYEGVRRHSRMSISSRGAQFAPFAALTGHDEAIRESERLNAMRMEHLDDTEAEQDKGPLHQE